MTDDSPLVSIVIPCYNAEAYVEAAVESVLAQTYEPIEIIVVDDGSEDGSLDVIQAYRDRVTFYQQENKGAPAARNRGMRLASGPLLKFLDADDLLYPEAIERQVSQLRQTGSDRTIVFGEGRFISGKGKEVEEATSYRAKEENEDPVAYILRVNPQTSLPLHRRSLLEEVDGFDERLPKGQEYDLHIRLSLADADFRYHPTPITMIRRHPGADRISNQTHLPEEPKRGRRRIRMMKEAGKLTEPVRQIMSHGAWQAGRTLLRQGRPDAAEKRFDLARRLHSDFVAGASPVYKWCVFLFGPYIAEKVGTWRRALSRLFG